MLVPGVRKPSYAARPSIISFLLVPDGSPRVLFDFLNTPTFSDGVTCSYVVINFSFPPRLEQSILQSST
jgi:hypothetical protein